MTTRLHPQLRQVNGMTNPRTLDQHHNYAREDIIQLIRDNDLSDTNTFLVFNGGTGLGKTRAIMTEVKPKLELKFNKSQTILVVESRSVTVAQLNTSYIDQIETFNGIDVCQRLGFMHHVERNDIDYDWVVIDECHGLFSEAGFAEDAEYIVNWIRTHRPEHTHIIFATANDEYFEDLSRKYFPGNFNFIYLFPDFTHYVSNTYVKEIQFIKTNRIDNTISVLLRKQAGKKGIVFFKRASAVKDWFFQALNMQLHAGIMVSRANETSASLTTYQEKLARDAAINISEGQSGLNMADFEDLINAMRESNGLENIRAAVNQERLPQDLDILLVTDTLQEGVSIKSQIDYIIIEGFTEVEVRQKLGRYRGNLNLLYIVFNPTTARQQTEDKLAVFNQLLQWQQEGNQTALAEFYGTQKGLKSKTLFLKKRTDSQTGISFYTVNEPALYNCQREFQLYTRLIGNTEQAVLESYSYPLLEGAPKILNYNDDIKYFTIEEKVKAIADKWRGIPLKGATQEELVQDFIDAGIVTNNRHAADGFTKCCIQFRKYNIELKEKQANLKDLENWPQYLTKRREKFKIII